MFCTVVVPVRVVRVVRVRVVLMNVVNVVDGGTQFAGTQARHTFSLLFSHRQAVSSALRPFVFMSSKTLLALSMSN